MISDALSGVQSVQYCFTGSASAPSAGWQTAAESGGRYLFDYQSQNPDAETVYLHLKASDRAGNTLTWDSGAYTVQAAPDGSPWLPSTAVASPAKKRPSCTSHVPTIA